MSDPKTKTPGSALDALVRDAKKDLTPRIDAAKWDALEERVLAQMSQHSPLVDEIRAANGPERGRVRAMRIGVAVLAAAAAIAIVVKRDRDPATAPVDGTTSQVELTAGSIRATEGTGEVRIGGQAVTAGRVVRAGDVLETTESARAILERPRKVTWLIERDAAPGKGNAGPARASVKSAGESLVLALEDGAIEAQVTPVPSGEAFAVDVAAGTHLVRVAVHGTHLRVARSGTRVVVDLTEGVVSIGTPPRTGSTYGTLVTAPSHVEFDAADLEATLRIDHAPSSVRAAIPLGAREPSLAMGAARPEQPAAPLPGAIVPLRDRPTGGPATVPRPTAVLPTPEPAPLDPAGAAPGRATPPKPELPPREAIAVAVRDCASARSRPANVRVTVTSSLKLKIAAGGDVETATFDPPLLPEIQSCAATAIYQAKISEAAGTTVTIPIDFSY